MKMFMRFSAVLAWIMMMQCIASCSSQRDKKSAGLVDKAEFLGERNAISYESIDEYLAPLTPPGLDESFSFKGFYTLNENPAVKLIIDDLNRIKTNLTIPLPAGNGTRLTPQLPHRLKKDPKDQFFKTGGYFNKRSDEFINITLVVTKYIEAQGILELAIITHSDEICDEVIDDAPTEVPSKGDVGQSKGDPIINCVSEIEVYDYVFSKRM